MKRGIRLAAILLFIPIILMTACTKPKDGLSAYEIAVKNGFVGTEAQWLESLHGKDGDNASTVYRSLYDEAKERLGYTGSFEEFLREYLGTFAGSEPEVGSISKAADTALMSAVSVFANFTRTITYYDRRGQLQSRQEAYSSVGAGVIIWLDEEKGDARILTNYHIVHDAASDTGFSEDVEVYVYGRENIEKLAVHCTVVGGTGTYDLAVIEAKDSEILRTSNLHAAEFAALPATPGDEIFTVGNPEILGLALTAGVVSVDSEYIEMTSLVDGESNAEYRVMRIDAAVNGGNSGGGVFNLEGKLVGLVNAKISDADIENIAYAIPGSLARRVYENIVRNCDGDTNMKVLRSSVGASAKVTDSYAYYDELTKDITIVDTVEITSVTSGGPADGKLMVGDVVKAYEYKGTTYAVTRRFDLTEAMLTIEAGESVTFTVIRGGEEQKIPVTPSSMYID